ncbi:MAG: hypothetical protein H7A23_03580 [Leptospiraceae bacterium]|nr:hypothetical protein [Leptospiraceae bacterium]MCP5493611.1 hypothetical protein [Leptospiraceae bacterium]
MSEEIELQLLKEIEELKSRLAKFENSQVDITPTYNYSKITFETLNSIVKIEAIDDKNIFQKWFDADIKLDSDILFFLQELLNKEGAYLRYYYEEDLKAKFIIPILNKINFTLIDKKIKDFYEAKLTYKSDKFTLTGTVDYIVSKGLRYNEKPYFFIQEFKKTIEVSDPEPQLLAELISAVELNDFKEIKGAYIIGSIWNFVVLERLERHKYIYYISQNFDSTKPEDLKAIYKNLLFVKLEIIEKVEKEI